MKGISGQYMYELVSLTILALMIIALIAGQVTATRSHATQSGAASELPALAAETTLIVAAPGRRE